jgi:hypothetical protein
LTGLVFLDGEWSFSQMAVMLFHLISVIIWMLPITSEIEIPSIAFLPSLLKGHWLTVVHTFTGERSVD